MSSNPLLLCKQSANQNICDKCDVMYLCNLKFSISCQQQSDQGGLLRQVVSFPLCNKESFFTIFMFFSSPFSNCFANHYLLFSTLNRKTEIRTSCSLHLIVGLPISHNFLSLLDFMGIPIITAISHDATIRYS